MRGCMSECIPVWVCVRVWECISGTYLLWLYFSVVSFTYVTECVCLCARVFVFALLGLALSAFSHCYANFPDIHHIRFHYPLAGPPPPPPPAHNRWHCSPAVLHRVNSPCAWALK